MGRYGAGGCQPCPIPSCGAQELGVGGSLCGWGSQRGGSGRLAARGLEPAREGRRSCVLGFLPVPILGSVCAADPRWNEPFGAAPRPGCIYTVACGRCPGRGTAKSRPGAGSGPGWLPREGGSSLRPGWEGATGGAVQDPVCPPPGGTVCPKYRTPRAHLRWHRGAALDPKDSWRGRARGRTSEPWLPAPPHATWLWCAELPSAASV